MHTQFLATVYVSRPIRPSDHFFQRLSELLDGAIRISHLYYPLDKTVVEIHTVPKPRLRLHKALLASILLFPFRCHNFVCSQGCSREWTEVDDVHILFLTGRTRPPSTFVPQIYVTYIGP